MVLPFHYGLADLGDGRGEQMVIHGSTGGHNFHGRFEYLPLSSLQKAAEVVLAIMIKAGEQCKAVNERK